MNFLKKKIKNVVHGKRNKTDDDDDDFDNYVPAVPPHPSTLESGSGATDPSASFIPDFNTAFSSLTSAADSAAKSIANTLTSVIPDLSGEDAENKATPLSFEELKAIEEEHKKQEKEKLKEKEESKKGQEDWDFFLSLTAKVDAVTSKTQSLLNKLKDDTAITEISKTEDIDYLNQFDQAAPKEAGGWVAFEEHQQNNPADPINFIEKSKGECDSV